MSLPYRTPTADPEDDKERYIPDLGCLSLVHPDVFDPPDLPRWYTECRLIAPVAPPTTRNSRLDRQEPTQIRVLHRWTSVFAISNQQTLRVYCHFASLEEMTVFCGSVVPSLCRDFMLATIRKYKHNEIKQIALRQHAQWYEWQFDYLDQRRIRQCAHELHTVDEIFMHQTRPSSLRAPFQLNASCVMDTLLSTSDSSRKLRDFLALMVKGCVKPVTAWITNKYLGLPEIGEAFHYAATLLAEAVKLMMFVQRGQDPYRRPCDRNPLTDRRYPLRHDNTRDQGIVGKFTADDFYTAVLLIQYTVAHRTTWVRLPIPRLSEIHHRHAFKGYAPPRAGGYDSSSTAVDSNSDSNSDLDSDS